MRQYLSNDELILDAHADLHRAATVLAHAHLDQKNPFQSLRPRHGDMAPGRLRALPALPFRFFERPAPRARSARASDDGERKCRGSESGDPRGWHQRG